ncbi:DUF6223 family protein [Streptomyces sp. NPDC056112]|nr:DUF6223 family protein [Streptomyces sp. CoT10]
MSVRFVLAGPASAHDSVQSAAVYNLTTGRLVGSTATLAPLADVVIGLTLARSAGRIGTGNGGIGGALALVLGLIAAVLGWPWPAPAAPPHRLRLTG